MGLRRPPVMGAEMESALRRLSRHRHRCWCVAGVAAAVHLLEVCEAIGRRRVDVCAAVADADRHAGGVEPLPRLSSWSPSVSAPPQGPNEPMASAQFSGVGQAKAESVRSLPGLSATRVRLCWPSPALSVSGMPSWTAEACCRSSRRTRHSRHTGWGPPCWTAVPSRPSRSSWGA